MTENVLSLDELSQQHMARREAQFDAQISLEYRVLNDDGEIEKRTLRLRHFHDVPGTARGYHANLAYKQLLMDVAEEGDAVPFLTMRHPKGHAGPTELEFRAVWEIIGIEYGYVDSSGMTRLDRQYQQMREAQVKQRKMLDQPTKRKRRKPSSGKKAKGKRKP